jgi:hypothetical protein
LSLHTELLLLFENAALLREILIWGRESSRQVQDLKIVHLPTTDEAYGTLVKKSSLGE